MKKPLLVLLSYILFVYDVQAQSFVRTDTIRVVEGSDTLVNAWAGGLNYPQFWPIDLNGDGIMDLVTYDPAFQPGHYALKTFINYGTAGKVDYHFAPEYISRFPDVYAWMVLYDYNCDGKMDLFCLSTSCSCGIMVYRNDYSQSDGLKFTPVKDPLPAYYGNTQNNIPANSVSVPALLDVDEDGDMDIVGWPVFGGGLPYYKGLRVDSGWPCDSLRFKEVTACWGHFGFIQSSNKAMLGINCRQADPGGWDTGIAANDDTQSCICIYDQDGDDIKDVLVGGFNDDNVLYLHNGGTLFDANIDYQDTLWPVYTTADSLSSFPCSYNMDVDNDGKKDMVIAPHSVNDWRGIQFYKNTNVLSDTGIYMKQVQGFMQQDMIDVGTSSCPQFFDYDCDGLADLLVGNGSYHDTIGVDKKGIALYKNVGTSSAPAYQLITRDFAGINALNGLDGPFATTFGDIDGDGDPDMITGAGDGRLYLYMNTANSCSPANFLPPSGHYMGIDVGQYSVPQLYDLDHDGVLDLIVGNAGGIVKYYRNTGTVSNAVFSNVPAKDTLGGVFVRDPDYSSGNAAPVFYNDTGVVRLMVGTYGGKLYIYDNITGNELGNYHLADSLINGEEGQNLVPAIGDVNNDNHPDLVVGNTNGGVSLYMNGFMIAVNELYLPLPSFYAYPNPADEELHFSFYNRKNSRARLEILNSIGQVMVAFPVKEDAVTVAVKSLAAGIYLARFISEANEQTLKVVVKH